MIISALDRMIKDMKDLQRLENLQANKEQQESTDAKYRVLVTNLHHLVVVIEYLHQVAQIKQDDVAKNEIILLLDELKMVTESGLADKDKVTVVETKLTSIQAGYKKSWTKQYSQITIEKVSTLKVISGIDPENVTACLRDIQKAEVWNTDITGLKIMMAGLESAAQLITNLGLNQGIISFLQNMNQGKATLADLTEEVLIWISEEDLQTKIKLSFSVGNRT